MCLFANEKKTLKARKARKGFCIRYKVLRARIDSSLFQLQSHKPTIIGLISPFYHKVWKPGWNKSNARFNKNKIPYRINTGIHVYVSSTTAKSIAGYNSEDQIFIPVKCYVKDLLGVDGEGEEAYQKVFLEKKDFEKIVKLKKKKVA
jgi:hypothetical protein